MKSMKKIIFILTLLITCGLTMFAQNLSEAEVVKLINQAFVWYQEGKYKESFDLSGRVLKNTLTEGERGKLQSLYVASGYGVVLSYLSTENQRYREAREIISRILPYTNASMKARILPKIPMSWYFEGVVLQIHQQYDQAMACMEKAREGFHEVGEIGNEVDALCQLATIKEHLYDMLGALDIYRVVQRLVIRLNDNEKLMEILKAQYQLASLIGDTESAFDLSSPEIALQQKR